MKSLLFVSVSLCIGSAEPVVDPESVPFVVTAPVEVKEEKKRNEEMPARRAGPRKAEVVGAGGGDELTLLSDHLAALGRSLEETREMVVGMAQQRDEARAEAARFQRDHTESQKELARVRKELASARSEGVRWKKVAGSLEEKVKAGAMAHAELQQFRGELQGAIQEFQALKGDFGKARSELADPIERAGLKKSVNGLERERERLQNEIEIALKERTGLREQLARQKEEAERMSKDVKETKQALQAGKKELGDQVAAARKLEAG